MPLLIFCSHKLLNLCLRFREQGDFLFIIKLVYFSFSYIACTERENKITCTLYYTFKQHFDNKFQENDVIVKNFKTRYIL